jgi:pimeloyl-ACP methyl ester carboxylesterase
MVPVDDTALAVTDTGGPGIPLVYLNGQFAAQTYWRRAIAELGSEYRHITYDERARGRSKRSKDYSFETAVRDVDAVLRARAVTDPPILVGWSFGAAIAVHWANRNTDRVRGVVSVDGAYPYDYTDEAALERIRKMFHRMRLLIPVLGALRLTARMSAEQQAESNIELLEICAKLEPILDGLTVPVRYIVASGGSFGGGPEQMEQMRASLEPVLARNPHITSVRVTSNHAKVLTKDFRAVADAVRELAAAHSPKTG